MTTHRSCLSVLVLMVVAVGLAGCPQGLVQVVDPAGNPVEGADVMAVSLGAITGPNTTNGSGETYVPHNMHDVKWIQVSKPWHRTVQVDLPETWPLRVLLVPTPGNRCP